MNKKLKCRKLVDKSDFSKCNCKLHTGLNGSTYANPKRLLSNMLDWIEFKERRRHRNMFDTNNNEETGND